MTAGTLGYEKSRTRDGPALKNAARTPAASSLPAFPLRGPKQLKGAQRQEMTAVRKNLFTLAPFGA